MKHKTTSTSGAYLGGRHWAMALLFGCQDSIISIEQYAKLLHAPPPPPPFVTRAESLSAQADRLWVKKFFFGLYLILGRKTD